MSFGLDTKPTYTRELPTLPVHLLSTLRNFVTDCFDF